jgi:16S rRNA (guanine966-N2)-methyltransferase
MAGRQAGGKNRSRNSPSGRLRIVAGMWRSRVLAIADVPGLRPTPERVRETLFNWLSPLIAGARCLDLFAGTGALGLEALSRGAKEAVFVEKNPVALAALQGNIRVLDAKGAEVAARDAFAYLASLPRNSFDVVFLDPPFADDALGELCRLLADRGVLAPRGRLYLEQDRARNLPDLPPGWTVLKNKTAGNVRYALVAPGTGDTKGEGFV